MKNEHLNDYSMRPYTQEITEYAGGVSLQINFKPLTSTPKEHIKSLDTTYLTYSFSVTDVISTGGINIPLKQPNGLNKN
jgi:hypothetical protein